MNKRAKEKQLLEEAYIQVLEEQSESKAPKGDSFDSENNYKPSGVDASSDGPGGRYRRIRINKPGRSGENHKGKKRFQDEEEKGGITIGDHVYEVGSNDPLGSGTIRKIIEYSNGYMIVASDGGLYSRMVDLKGQGVGEGYLVKQ